MAKKLSMKGSPKEVLRLVRGVAKDRLPPYFALARWLVDHELDYGCIMWPTGDWVQRKEEYGNKALFTVTIDGSPLYEVLNGDYPPEGRRWAQKMYEGLSDLLEQYGQYWELGLAWTLHVYEI